MLNVLPASRNAGKLCEFAELLPDLHLSPWPADAPSLPETGAFFSVSPAALRETSGPALGPSALLSGFSIAGAS
jgi:hypothetical protein